VFAFTVIVGDFPVNALFDIDNTVGFDSYIELLDASGSVVALSDDSPFVDDAGNPIKDPGSTTTADSYISHTFAVAGTYHWFLRVDSFERTGVPSGASYELQVVIPGHEIPGGVAPTIVVNGQEGSDTLNVAAGLMPISATVFNIVNVGPAPFAGTLNHGLDHIVSYTSVETFHGGAVYRVLTDVVTLGLQDGNPDSTFIRNNIDATRLLIDVNTVLYFSGNLDQLLIAAVNGSSDADTILVQGTAVAAHIDGRAGDDTITTAAAPDIVYGGDGNDTISTNGGDDYVAGGEGNDAVSGGDGNDSLHGNGGDDILAGEGGHDIVTGGAGNDQVSGQQGQDILIGGGGADQVLGNKDRDLLFAAGVVIHETGGPVSLGESDSSEFGDDNYFRLQALRQDWLDVVALALSFAAFDAKYDSTADDGVEDKLQGGQGDDMFITDGSATIVDTPFDQEVST
jgi:Ca2+-binding RTX toxin-like protein